MTINTVTITLTWRLDPALWGWHEIIDDLGPNPTQAEIETALLDMARGDPIGSGLLDDPTIGGAVWSVQTTE